MTARRWLARVLLICVVAGASFAVASAITSKQPAAAPRCGMDMSAGLGACMVTEYLQLTPEQERRAAPMTERFFVAQHAGGLDMQRARARLLAELKAAHPNRGDIDAALADIAASQAELQRCTAEYLLELKPVLTDEQENKLFEMVGQRFCRQDRCGGNACPAAGMQGRGMRSGRIR